MEASVPITQFVILGAGYTGQRVAAELQRLSRRVLCTRSIGGEGCLPFDVLDPAAG